MHVGCSDAASQPFHTFATVPAWQTLQIVSHRFIVGDECAVHVSSHVLVPCSYASPQRHERHSVLLSLAEWIESVVLASVFPKLYHTRHHVVAKLEVLSQKLFRLTGSLNTVLDLYLFCFYLFCVFHGLMIHLSFFYECGSPCQCTPIRQQR